MAIFRGDGGAGDSNTDATLLAVTAQAVIATTKASDAAASAVSASDSATTATTKAAAASTSATNAANSATGVAQYATAAANSATASANSATASATSATAASTAETNAETAETNAETAESNASTSAATATTKASEAVTSASSASTSASTATTKASEASTSATSASTSATTATTKASEATTSASGAATSASTATTKASEASTSATNAATSATAAAASAASIGTDPSFNSVTVTGSTAVKMPVGTTAERPTPVTGQLRYNSTLSAFEGYTTEWGEIGGGGSTDISLNTFTGDGSDVTFSLSAAAAENNTFVYISGVYQNKSTYAVSAADPAVVTFNTAPPNGTAIEIMSAAISVSNIGTPSDNTVTTAKIVDDAVTTAKIVDGAITAAKLAAGAGGVGPEYISATPTLSSSALNQIVIGNYSSYASPTFNTKVGSTIIPNTDNAGTLTLAAPFSLGGTQTVSVEGVYAGKLHSTSATVSVVLPSLTARYWRITNQVAASASTSQPPTLDGWQLFSSLNGGGTQRGSTTALTASQNQAGRYLSNVFLNNGNYNWYPYQYSGLVGDLWIVYDLGSPQEVLSMKWQNPGTSVYYATSWTLQNSSDNTNWVDIKYITQTASEATLRTINL